MWTYNFTYPDELYHYGVLGMKWGVRKNRLTYKSYARGDDWSGTLGPNASRRTKRSAKKADKIQQKRDYWEAEAYRSDKKARKANKKMEKLDKKEQKAITSMIGSSHKDNYRQANKRVNKQMKADYRNYLKSSLKPYKDVATGKIKNVPKDITESRSKEISMAVGMYNAKKQKKANKLTYLKDIGKQNSIRYKIGKRSFDSSVERFGNYTIRRLPNGNYHITKTYYY